MYDYNASGCCSCYCYGCLFSMEMNPGAVYGDGRGQLERSVEILASEEANGTGLSAEERQK